MDNTTPKFQAWAKVELFGHSVIVGKVTEASIGGCQFIRVDVPEVDGQQAYTKYYGNGAIYAMTPVTEEVAMRLLKVYQPVPINAYELPKALRAADDDDHDI